MVTWKLIGGLAALLLLNTVDAHTAPGRLVHVAHVPLEKARKVAFHQDRVYVGQNLLGMTVLDASDAAHPRIIRRFTPEESQPLSIKAVEPDLLVVADRFRGLVLWDLSNPDKPTTYSELSLPGIATDVDVTNIAGQRIAAVACGGEGLVTVDLTDPTSPTLLGKFATRIDYARRILLHGATAFLADHFDGGLKLIDLSDPTSLRPWYQVRIRGFCEHASLRGDLLSVSYRNYGLRLFRLHTQVADDTTTPQLTLLGSTARSRSRVRTTALLSKERLLVANDEAGDELYDVADPSLPCLVDEYWFSSPQESAQSCAEHNGLIYVPCWDGGLNVFRVEDVPSSS